MMNATISYQSDKGAYRLEVIKRTEQAANIYTATLTNTVTGATQTVDGWRNRVDAVDYVQRMYAARLI
jgi:hypothetical protein